MDPFVVPVVSQPNAQALDHTIDPTCSANQDFATLIRPDALATDLCLDPLPSTTLENPNPDFPLLDCQNLNDTNALSPCAPDILDATENIFNSELQEMHNAETEMNQMFTAMIDGKSMSNQDYLKLQNLMYQHQQSVNIVSKLINQTTSSVKQLLQTQL